MQNIGLGLENRISMHTIGAIFAHLIGLGCLTVMLPLTGSDVQVILTNCGNETFCTPA